jgi:hypothetical protein
MTGSTPNAKSMPDDTEEKFRSRARQVEHTAAEVERSASATQRSATATQRAAVATQQSVDRNTQLAVLAGI